jgi:hypothetical protein
MLTVLTMLVMLIVAWASFREGLFTSVATLVNVLLAGVVTYNFWEPLAGTLDSTLQGSFLDGYQDFVMIGVLFAVVLGVLRMITNNLAYTIIEFSPTLQQFGGAGVGLLTGYLLSGFLICAFETLPWHRNFIDFEPKPLSTSSHQESDFRRVLPPDRVWLALMRHAGVYPFARGSDLTPAQQELVESPYDRYPTFDRAGTFEQRYYRYRRYGDQEDPLIYVGELDRKLSGPVNVPAQQVQPSPAPAQPAPGVAPAPAPKDAPQPGKTPDGKGQQPPPSGTPNPSGK